MFGKVKYIISRLLNRKVCAIRNSKIDKKASVGNGAQIVGCEIGKYSYIYESNAVNAKIGAFCSIAPGCSIGGGSHPVDWVSTSPVFYEGKNVLHKNFSHKKYEEFKDTVIGNDVWIGAKCLIKGGVTIGDGAVIGMGSVVTKDIPPYEVWAGNPAKKIKDRFDDETKEKLLKLKWWEMSDEQLKKYGQYFGDPQEFIKETEVG